MWTLLHSFFIFLYIFHLSAGKCNLISRRLTHMNLCILLINFDLDIGFVNYQEKKQFYLRNEFYQIMAIKPTNFSQMLKGQARFITLLSLLSAFLQIHSRLSALKIKFITVETGLYLKYFYIRFINRIILIQIVCQILYHNKVRKYTWLEHRQTLKS